MLRYQPDLAKSIAVGVNSQAPQDTVKSPELTEYLFQHGMNPNHRNWLGITPLHFFAKRDDTDNAAIFIQHGAEVDVMDEEFCSTLLGCACKYGKKNMVNFLLDHGADPNLPSNSLWAKPLAWAARREYEEIVALLKQYGANE